MNTRDKILLRRRGMMQATTPPQPVIPYQRVEYLESDGHQSILLDMSGNGRLIIDAQGTSTKSSSQCLIINNSLAGAGTWFGIPGGKAYWGIGATVLFTNSYSERIVATVDFVPGACNVQINGVNKTRSGSYERLDWSLFGPSSSSTYTFIGRVFDAIVFDANMQLVGHYYPVRDGQTGYLYDVISGQLFGNQGTDDFILGPDVQ